MELDNLTDEEVAVMLFALEREWDWARHGEDYEMRDEYLDACEFLLDRFNKEYEKRNLNPSIIGTDR
ncbi:MAG: hypothetical protein ACXAD7_24410 [Candidatus Kariarchaeaceae archaeon]|jgi:hypothetical protein